MTEPTEPSEADAIAAEIAADEFMLEIYKLEWQLLEIKYKQFRNKWDQIVLEEVIEEEEEAVAYEYERLRRQAKEKEKAEKARLQAIKEAEAQAEMQRQQEILEAKLEHKQQELIAMSNVTDVVLSPPRNKTKARQVETPRQATDDLLYMLSQDRDASDTDYEEPSMASLILPVSPAMNSSPRTPVPTRMGIDHSSLEQTHKTPSSVKWSAKKKKFIPPIDFDFTKKGAEKAAKERAKQMEEESAVSPVSVSETPEPTPKKALKRRKEPPIEEQNRPSGEPTSTNGKSLMEMMASASIATVKTTVSVLAAETALRRNELSRPSTNVKSKETAKVPSRNDPSDESMNADIPSPPKDDEPVASIPIQESTAKKAGEAKLKVIKKNEYIDEPDPEDIVDKTNRAEKRKHSKATTELKDVSAHPRAKTSSEESGQEGDELEPVDEEMQTVKKAAITSTNITLSSTQELYTEDDAMPSEHSAIDASMLKTTSSRLTHGTAPLMYQSDYDVDTDRNDIMEPDPEPKKRGRKKVSIKEKRRRTEKLSTIQQAVAKAEMLTRIAKLQDISTPKVPVKKVKKSLKKTTMNVLAEKRAEFRKILADSADNEQNSRENYTIGMDDVENVTGKLSSLPGGGNSNVTTRKRKISKRKRADEADDVRSAPNNPLDFLTPLKSPLHLLRPSTGLGVMPKTPKSIVKQSRYASPNVRLVSDRVRTASASAIPITEFSRSAAEDYAARRLNAGLTTRSKKKAVKSTRGAVVGASGGAMSTSTGLWGNAGASFFDAFVNNSGSAIPRLKTKPR